jgi:hypothetical protein
MKEDPYASASAESTLVKIGSELPVYIVGDI